VQRFTEPRNHSQEVDQAGFVRQVILIGIAIIVLFGIVNVYKLASNQSTSTIPEVRSGILGYCLDDHHNGKAVNAIVDIWVCNGTAAQNWIVSSNAIKHGSSQCLDVQNNGTLQNDKVVLNTCNGSPGEGWNIDLGGYENPNSGLCLDALGNKTDTQLVISSCNDLTQAGEAWTAATWSDKNDSAASCVSGSKGEQVACYAEKQWAAWQTGSPSHQTLLDDYTDGNSYEEWCADFVSYVYKEAGYPFAGGERNSWDEYDANNIQNMGFTMYPASDYTPKPGDIAFFNYSGGHVEIVVTGGKNPTFIYGDSNTTDPSTGNGEMNEDSLTSDGSAGQVVYYLSPNI
jgi:hypothetical protein